MAHSKAVTLAAKYTGARNNAHGCGLQ
jgi:hypothetical protein